MLATQKFSLVTKQTPVMRHTRHTHHVTLYTSFFFPLFWLRTWLHSARPIGIVLPLTWYSEFSLSLKFSGEIALD